MTVTHARALIPDLVLAEAVPAEDEAALRRLALWALRYSPIVGIDPPDGLWIDAAGCSHLFGGEAGLLHDLVDRLGGAGFAASAAMAGTAGAAHALARFGTGPTLLLGEGEERRALAALPVRCLRLPEATLAGLGRLGLDRVGQICDMPRAPLVRRFGTGLVRRLDQALGLAPEPLPLVEPVELARAACSFVEPIGTPGHLRRAIGDLAQELCADLVRRGLGARRLDLAFHRVDANVVALRVGTASPSRDPAHLARLLADRLDTVDPGFGVEAMALTASLAEPLEARQIESGPIAGGRSPGPAAPDLGALVDTLANRLGADRLYRLTPVESDVPERSLRVLPPLAPPAGATWPADRPRPARLLTPPERIDTMALLPDHAPAQFTWRGRRHRVRSADGPERVFGEWWREEAEAEAVRDYFQVEDDSGMRFWLYRSGDGVDPATGTQRWFMQGLFG